MSKPLHVALETNYEYIGRGGVTRYIVQLREALQTLPEIAQVTDIACKIPNHAFQQPRRAIVTAFREYIWTPLIAPLAVKKSGADILHMTCFSDIPAPKTMPTVVTLHDLSHIRFPNNYRPHTRRRWKALSKKMCDADAIITVSEFTKREAIDLLGISPSKLHSIPLAPTQLGPDARSVPPDLPLPKHFFLFLGSLAPNKNLRLLVETYKIARDRRIPLPPLLVVGISIPGVTLELKTPEDWIFLESVSDVQLQALYKMATALVYPSVYEGFGLPVVEAMNLGCAVVCSPVASLPEAGGDAACYADLDAEAYLNVLQRLAEDSSFREERIARGRIHAAHFSWTRAARDTVSVYNKVIEQKKGGTCPL